MAIQRAPSRLGEDTAEKKILNKGLAYLLQRDVASQADPTVANRAVYDPGELHELNTLLMAKRRSLFIDGVECKLPDHTYFSRERWDQALNALSPDCLRLFQLPAANQEAKVKYGDNEIDLVLLRGEDWVVVECKSGAASSTGSQTNSYVEAMLERSAQGQRGYFAYCYDSAVSDADYFPFFHKVFRAVRSARPAIYPAPPQYLRDATFDNAGKALTDLRVLIDKCVKAGVITERSGGDAAFVAMLNEILESCAGFRLHLFELPASSDDNLRDAVAKLIKSVHLTTGEPQLPESAFWRCVSTELDKIMPPRARASDGA